jgi:hypothetical protein
LLRSSKRFRAFVLAGLFLSLQGCAQSPDRPVASDCERFERALAEGREDECRRAKDGCLALVDQTIKERGEQMQALLTALGADTEREKVLRPAITKLEKDLSELKLKRERLSAAQCDKKQ